ncbi:hypothetical protein [Actinokineospora fastidiosa]|uniref:Uncharacterized protein n=1 Tax=Actinokineospora fastidiosa TaxID=1816 RepID=A0A918GQN8_9PSEU|nr:hypothetical protein [Actinokineospora fastidiosa]GGS54254.1 hypothetical protein GCM10010171_56720 [Actinokineospora fastidiosa]
MTDTAPDSSAMGFDSTAAMATGFVPAETGIDHVRGDEVAAVGQVEGAVHQGSGSINYFLAPASAPTSPRRSPREHTADLLGDLSARFVEGPGFITAEQRLQQPGTVVLTGDPGTGRRTAALMLLHRSGAGTSRFREVDVDGSDDDVDSFTVQSGERILLVMPDDNGESVQRRSKWLVNHHSAVRQAQAYLVVVCSSRAQHLLPDELIQQVCRLGRPQGAAVLTKHLAALGVTTWHADLTRHALADPMRDLARLAALIGQAKETADNDTDPAAWIAEGLAAYTEPVDHVQIPSNGRVRALTVMTALLEQARAEAVFTASESFLRSVRYPEDPIHPLEWVDLDHRLHDIEARVDKRRRVRFTKAAHGHAVLTYFWDRLPWLRTQLTAEINSVLGLRELDDGDRLRVARRFAAQSLRTGHTDDLFTAVFQWCQQRNLQWIGIQILADGLESDAGSVFRRQVYTWVTHRNLHRYVALALVRVCSESIAPTRPEQALVRLRHLTRNYDSEVASTAREALILLAKDDPAFLTRLLSQLCKDLAADPVKPTDVTLFTAVIDPRNLAQLTTSTLSAAADLTAEAWRVLLRRHQATWLTALEATLTAAAEHGPELLVSILLASCRNDKQIADTLFTGTRIVASRNSSISRVTGLLFIRMVIAESQT